MLTGSVKGYVGKVVSWIWTLFPKFLVKLSCILGCLNIQSFTEGYGKWKLNRSLKATKWFCKETMKVCYKEHMKRRIAPTCFRIMRKLLIIQIDFSLFSIMSVVLKLKVLSVLFLTVLLLLQAIPWRKRTTLVISGSSIKGLHKFFFLFCWATESKAR